MHDYLTTSEVAGLLRIKERKVYDLAASGAIPCSKAMGKLLFPREQVNRWLQENTSGLLPALPVRPAVFLGSHDPLLEWALRESRCGLAQYFDGSVDGLRRFAKREGIAAGIHIYNSPVDEWNTAAVREHCAAQPAVLLKWARRRRGLVLGASFEGNVSSLQDLPGCNMIARQSTAGAQSLLLEMLDDNGVDASLVQFNAVARSELDLAQMLVKDEADAGFGLQSIADTYKLRFIPIVEEQYDLLVDRYSYFQPEFQALLAFCNSSKFRKQARGMSGYNIRELGTVHYNASV